MVILAGVQKGIVVLLVAGWGLRRWSDFFFLLGHLVLSGIALLVCVFLNLMRKSRALCVDGSFSTIEEVSSRSAQRALKREISRLLRKSLFCNFGLEGVPIKRP